jgi:Ca2+-binding EF-hand superfamily protein
MGGNQVKFHTKDLEEFEETTPFNKAEISHTFVRFRELYVAYPQSDSSVYHIVNNQGIANPKCSLPISFITKNLPELKNNPFREQICQAFCLSADGMMNFIEFLEMVSSFSPKADTEKKIYHAFQIFDIDKDRLLSRKDLYCVMDMMTGVDKAPLVDEKEKKEWEKVKKWIVDGVFYEANKRETVTTEEEETNEITDGEICDDYTKESLTIEDFRFCINRSPDFKSIFSFKI